VSYLFCIKMKFSDCNKNNDRWDKRVGFVGHFNLLSADEDNVYMLSDVQ
jgi:hypothetical protein